MTHPATTPAAGGEVTLANLHAANIARQAEWCPDQLPDLSFRGNELAGETGEACNVIKKLERERQGWRGSRATKEQLAEELADVVICADLCAVTAGIDLDAAVRDKFNATSEKVGLTTKLAALSAPSPAAGATGGVPEQIEREELLLTSAEKSAAWLTQRLADANWRPSRANVEAARNAIRDATAVGRRLAAIAAAPKAPTPVTSAPGAGGPANWTLSNKAREEIAEIDRATVMSPSLSGFAPYTPITVRSGTSAPGAEGGDDLAALSARATPGFIAAAGYGTDIRASDGVIAMTSPTRSTGKEDRAFIVELWNAYRSGRLTPAAPTPAPVAQGEPVAWLWEYADSSGTWHEIASVEKPNPGGRRNIRPLGLISGAGSLPAKQGEPSAWAYEELKTRTFDTWEPALSYGQPEPASYHRNIRPLYAAPAAPRPADLPGREEIQKAHATAIRHTDWWKIPEDRWLQIFSEYLPAFVAALLTPPSPTQEMRAAGGNTQAARDVLAERRRQVEVEGYGTDHDDAMEGEGQLSGAAACYAFGTRLWTGDPNGAGYLRNAATVWPWADRYWKPNGERRNLVKAGALILAEIERLDRAAGGEDRGGQ